MTGISAWPVLYGFGGWMIGKSGEQQGLDNPAVHRFKIDPGERQINP
jgi:hypothetical protein